METFGKVSNDFNNMKYPIFLKTVQLMHFLNKIHFIDLKRFENDIFGGSFLDTPLHVGTMQHIFGSYN